MYRKAHIAAVLFIFSMCACMNIPVIAGKTREFKIGELRRCNIQSVAWNGKYTCVAVGDLGIILVSENNGLNWTIRKAPITCNLRGVAWSGDKYIAVGENGSILISVDGTTWSQAISDSENTLHSVASDGNIYCAVGNNGTVLVSYDGRRWSRVRLATGESLVSVAWIGDRFVAVGRREVILTSSDGIVWETIKSDPHSDTEFTDIAGNTNSLIVVDEKAEIQIFNNFDWQSGTCFYAEFPSSAPLNKHLYAVEFGKDVLVAAGSGGMILISSDGKEWTGTGLKANKSLRDIKWCGERFVSVGDNGTIIVSENGIKWDNITNIQIPG